MNQLKDALLIGLLCGTLVFCFTAPLSSVLALTALVVVLGGGWWLGQSIAEALIAWLDPTDTDVISDVD